MCGLAGFIKHPDINPTIIETMIARILHRGPDYTGFYSDEFISLAHARLSILDLSEKANQPFISNDGRYVMSYNGEVYNFKEIASEMSYQPKTSSDTEIILELYTRLGDSFLDKLNGMFAIAIYDTQKKELNLYRDRFGIKPLYYYYDGRHFAFASELKSLTALPFEKSINHQALNDYLNFEYIPQPNTIYHNFFKLGNGKSLKYINGEIEVKSYYNILDKIDPSETISEKEALVQFESLFQKSISYRKISDVAIGAFLSGGVDSSMVCATFKSQSNELSSFNIGFDNAQYDESKSAQKVAQELRLNHHNYKLTSGDLLQSFDTIYEQFDEPFAVSSIFPTYKVSQIAKENITVALSGDGGDELFMGYGHYTWYKRLKHFDNILGKRIRYTTSNALKFLPSKYARVAKLLRYDSLSIDWPHVWSQEQYMFSSDEINQLTGSSNYVNSLTDSWIEIRNRVKDPYLQLSLFDIKHYLPDDLLYKVDMASMKNSLEVRLPFLDHNLVEQVMNWPTSLKIKHGEQKYLLKKHLNTYLSHDLVYRKKWGFGAPIDEWIKSELKNKIDHYLNEERIKEDGLFDPLIVQSLLNQFFNGQHHLYKRIWALLSFQIWKEKHFD